MATGILSSDFENPSTTTGLRASSSRKTRWPSIRWGQNNITSADIGLDLELIGRSSAFIWRSERADDLRPVISVAEAGIHTIHIWMGEDGAKLDRILLTTDQLYDASAEEPDESPHAPFHQITADLNDDDIVDLRGLLADWLKLAGPCNRSQWTASSKEGVLTTPPRPGTAGRRFVGRPAAVALNS